MKLPALAKNLAAADGLQAKLQLLELVRGAGVPLDRAEAARSAAPAANRTRSGQGQPLLPQQQAEAQR